MTKIPQCKLGIEDINIKQIDKDRKIPGRREKDDGKCIGQLKVIFQMISNMLRKGNESKQRQV